MSSSVRECQTLDDMKKKQREPSERVTVRVGSKLRGDLKLLAQQDKRDDESDYWRKVLSDHVDDMRRSGKLPLVEQMPLGRDLEVEVRVGGAAR